MLNILQNHPLDMFDHQVTCSAATICNIIDIHNISVMTQAEPVKQEHLFNEGVASSIKRKEGRKKNGFHGFEECRETTVGRTITTVVTLGCHPTGSF